MATGRLGTQDITSANTYYTPYQVPANTFSVVTVSITNRSSSNVATVRLAITTSVAPNPPLDAEFLEYDSQILANGVLERTGIVMEAGKYISVRAAGTGLGLSVTIMGIETTSA
jgi:hypothetical protein